jgi:hypothetical protein
MATSPQGKPGKGPPDPTGDEPVEGTGGPIEPPVVQLAGYRSKTSTSCLRLYEHASLTGWYVDVELVEIRRLFPEKESGREDQTVIEIGREAEFLLCHKTNGDEEVSPEPAHRRWPRR